MCAGEIHRDRERRAWDSSMMNNRKSDKNGPKSKNAPPLPRIGKGMTAVEIPVDVMLRSGRNPL